MSAPPAASAPPPRSAPLLIAIPTYDERENIAALLPAVLALHPAAHLLVVVSRREIWQAAVTLVRIARQRMAP